MMAVVQHSNRLGSPGGNRQRLHIEIPSTVESLADARRALETLKAGRRALNDAKLLLTELLTNSIKHSGLRAGDPIEIDARCRNNVLRVDVHDRSRAPANAKFAGTIRPDPGAESGWGLFIIQRIASRWGNRPGHYWFEVPLNASKRSA